ncbi:MAG: PKD domain-containing protein [Saprospiraceae bacterium]
MQDPGVHVFPGNGDYTVTLTVENACGTETFSQVISINGSVSAAGFDTDVRRFCAPGTVNFTDASTGNPTVWKWTFPGGNPATSTDQNPSVTYDTPGTYGVSLEVTNSFGTNQVMQTAFIIAEAAPVADFTSSIMDATVTFSNTSSGAVTYSWDFGDGETSNEESPEHTYASSGTYTVTLSVTNSCGTETKTEEVVTIIISTDNLAFLESLIVFPNPNNGQFVVRMNGNASEFVDFKLMNNLGQIIHNEKVGSRSGNLNKEFNHLNLSSGVYILQIRSGNQVVYRKIQVH